MSFTNHVLGLFNNTWSGDHKAYQAAAIGAKRREILSYHRDMMKAPDGKRVVSVFAALDENYVPLMAPASRCLWRTW